MRLGLQLGVIKPESVHGLPLSARTLPQALREAGYVTAIAGKTGTTIVKVRSPRMLLAHGFLRTVFDIFDRHRTSVDVVATSEVSISATVDEPEHLDALVVDLAPLGDVSVERGRGIVAVVGAGIGDDSAAMGRALAAVHGTKIHMLSLSATGINLTMILDAEEVAPAMQRLHGAFFDGDSVATA